MQILPRKRPLTAPQATALDDINAERRQFSQTLAEANNAFKHALLARTPDAHAKNVIADVTKYCQLITEHEISKHGQPSDLDQLHAIQKDEGLAAAFNKMVFSADYYNLRSQVPVPAQNWRKHQETKRNPG